MRKKQQEEKILEESLSLYKKPHLAFAVKKGLKERHKDIAGGAECSISFVKNGYMNIECYDIDLRE